MTSSSSCALCGWVPTEQKTSGNRSAMASRSACCFTRVEIVTMRPIAGRRARADDGVELAGKIRKIEMAMAVDQHGVMPARSPRARRSAETPARAPAASRPARCGCAPPSAAKSRSPVRHRQQVEQLAGRRRHERLRQDRHLPDHLGGDVEHGALPRRIGLGQRPGRLAGEIAVGVGDHRPDRVEHLVQLLRLHRLARLADHGVGGGQDRLVGRR